MKKINKAFQKQARRSAGLGSAIAATGGVLMHRSASEVQHAACLLLCAVLVTAALHRFKSSHPYMTIACVHDLCSALVQQTHALLCNIALLSVQGTESYASPRCALLR